MTTFGMSTSFRSVFELLQSTRPLKLGTAIHGGQRYSFCEDTEEGKSHVHHNELSDKYLMLHSGTSPQRCVQLLSQLDSSDHRLGYNEGTISLESL